MSILFDGNARIYLQGKDALLPITDSTTDDQIKYYIGDASTRLVVYDHRKKTVLEAQEAIHLHYQNGFAKSFNQYARVKIQYDDINKQMDIDLVEDEQPTEKCPVLWMGILENNIMPGYEVQWEVFKPLSFNQTAFVAFISQE